MSGRVSRVAYFISTFLIAVIPVSCAPPKPEAMYLQLLRVTHRLADQGNLDDPKAVERLLRTTFTPNVTRRGSPKACPDEIDAPERYPQEEIDYQPEGNFWFQTQPGGQSAEVFNIFTREVARTGKPKLSYTVRTDEVCYRGARSPAFEATSNLTFENIPGFACIPEEQLGAGFPSAKRSRATDGAIPYYYAGRTTKTSGVGLIFDYVFGQKCLLSIRMYQDVRHSTVHQDAEKSIDVCINSFNEQSRTDDYMARSKELRRQCGSYWDYLPGGRRS